MTVVSIILGILLIIGGFSCMFTPLATFLYTGYFFTVMLFVYGVFGIFRFFNKQAGGLEFAVSILAVIIGIMSMVMPGQTLVFDRMVLYLISAWLLIQGIMSIVVSIQVRKVRKGWYWGLIAGIIGVILGIYSFAHPLLLAVTEGFLIGFFFLESGFDMIVLGCAIGDAKKAAGE